MSLSDRIATGRSARETAVDQRLRDRARALQRLAVADAAPVAAVDPLGDEGALGARVAQCSADR